MINILMPKLGLVMKEGEVSKWLKIEGEYVQEGEIILNIETEKLSSEYESPGSGILHIIEPDGSKVPVSTLIAQLLSEGESPVIEDTTAADPVAEQMMTDSAAQSPATLVAPAAATGKVRATPAAKRIARDQGIDLSTVAVTRNDGVVDKLAVEAYLEGVASGQVSATPLARREAERSGVDLEGVSGSGARGKVTEKDVIASRPFAAVSGYVDELGRSFQRQTLSTLGKVMSNRMSASGSAVVPVTITAEVEMSECANMKGKLPFKASYTAIMAAAVTQALRKHPKLNASLDGDELVQFSTINLGIAVDTEKGLMVPSIPSAEQKPLREIVDDLHGISDRAHESKLSLDELSRGTFTLTNLGMFGIDRFTPVVNLPEVAILGVGVMNQRVVEIDGIMVSKPFCSFSLTFDHRVIDGATGARFLMTVKQFLENPYAWVTGM